MKKWLLILGLSSSWSLAAQTPAALLAHRETTGPAGSSRVAAVTKDHPVIRQVEPSPATGSSQAVVVDEVPLAHTALLLPLDPKGALVGKGDVARQTNQVFDNIDAALQEAGTGLGQVVKINVYLADAALMAPVQKQFGRKFRGKVKPAVSFVVGELAQAGALVAMDAVAAAPDAAAGSQVTCFRSAALPGQSPAAHVSVLPAGGVAYVSGQADQGDLVAATRGTLRQLAATLAHLGLQKQDVVQIKAFVQPMAQVGLVDRELASFFQGLTLPPVVYVDWLSRNPVIEIELIAASPKTPAGEPLSFITPPFMTASPVYSKVVRINHGRKVYVSGLYGEAAADAQVQVSSLFASLQEVLQKAGSDFRHLAKATYYVSNDQTSTRLNEIRPKFYDPRRPPAASKAMVKGVGLAGSGITLDMIGVVVN